MKQIHQRSVVAILVVALTVTGAGLTATPVAADHDCSNVNKATWFAFSGASLIGEATDGSGVGCDMWHEDTEVQKIRDMETNQTHSDLYAAAEGQRSQRDVLHSISANYLNDTEAIAWMKAEAAIAQAYENGSSKSVAKQRAKEAIDDYYATKQINLIEDWATHAQSMRYITERAKQEGIGTSDSGGHNRVLIIGDGTYNGRVAGLSNYTYTLANGSSYTATVPHVEGGEGTSWLNHDLDLTDEYVPESNGNHYRMYLRAPPDSSLENVDPYINFTDNAEKWNLIQTKNQNVQSETDAFVDATWQDFQDGNIDSTDVISRTTLMFEFGTKTTNGSGNYYDMVGAAAGMGLDTPNLNSTGVMQMTIPDAGNSYEGLVFARNAPNNTWVVGETYDPANISGPVMFATTDGQLFQVERPFTIDKATDTEGNDQSEVSTTNYNYQTADTSELRNKYAELLNFTEELQQRQEELYEGGGGGGTGSPSPYNIVAILVAAGALLYAAGSRNGNKR